MKSKKIKLKNNLTVTLNLSNLDDVYFIKAVSCDGLVGECNFNIVLQYVLDTSTLSQQDQLTPLAKELLSEGLKVSPSRLSGYKKVDNRIKLDNFLLSYNNTFIELNKILVSNEKYGEVGLGYEMLKMLEEVASKHNATQIRANFYPFGRLKLSSMKFYQRNGFIFNKSKIHKDLKTPINVKSPSK